MTLTAHQTSLSTAYQLQKANYSNRSTAIFPLRISRAADQRIVFLNYWLLKNKIERVLMNLRVYDAGGKKVLQTSSPVTALHNDIGVRALLGDIVPAGGELEGMIEVEFVSTDNLVFNFPGIAALYEGGGAFSVVHSAGRVRNSDEPYKDTLSEETNWFCKYAPGIAPFVHVFNGPRTQAEHTVVLRLYDAENKVVAERRLSGLVEKPFSSKIVYFDRTFEPAELRAMAFAGLSIMSNEVFPRLVVGNYHRERDFLEVTHSYPNMRASTDFVETPPEKDYAILSYLPLPQPPELELEGVIFPTNAATSATGTLRRTADVKRPLEPTSETVSLVTGGEGARVFTVRPRAEDRLLSVEFQGRFPSRTNTSHRFSVRGAGSPLSTDIASGAKPWVFPPKHSHWGHGLVSRDFDTVITLNNVAHRVSERGANTGTLTIYLGDGTHVTTRVDVLGDGVSFVYLRSLVPALAAAEAPQTLSWILKMERPNVDAFWVAYAKDGRVLGDHAF